MNRYIFFPLFSVFRIPLLAAFLFMLPGTANSQIDKEFWFVGPEASANHGDRPVYIRVSTLDEASNITLRMPANTKFIPVKNLIPANSTFSIRLDDIGGDQSWLDSIENRPPDVVLRKGFLLTSDKYITSYYEINNTSNPAIFPFKGKNALGTDFFIPGQNNYANQVNDGSEAFDIVATQDTTTITITPSIDIVGHSAGVPFQIILNKGETYSARTLNTSASASLSGSHVVADKPVAITISDDSIITGGWDIIGDQIIPVNLLGNEYIAIKGFADTQPTGSSDERVYILATQDLTDIWIDGNPVPVATLSAGAMYCHQLTQSTNTALVKSGKPVYVYHLSGHPGEAGASVLPQDSCTGSRKIGFNRSSSSAFAMMILTRSGNEGSFQLNGNNSLITAPEFSPVPGTNGNWVYFRQNNMPLSEVPIGGNLLENLNGKFHMGILNNVGASSEYGYFSDFSTLYLGADASMCPGDSMMLDAGPYRNTYLWKRMVGGNWQVVGTGQTYACHDTGFFACQTDGDFCTLHDTIRISYYPNASVSLGADTSICEGTTITLSPGNYQSYTWNNGSTSNTLTTGIEGEVWVSVLNINGCLARDTIFISVDSMPLAGATISGQVAVCQGQSPVTYSVPSLKYADWYEWLLPPGATGNSATHQITVTFGSGAQSGNISVRGVNDCGAGDWIVFPVTVNPVPGNAGQITAPALVCQGQTGIAVSVPPITDATNYIWTYPSGFSMTGPPGNSVYLSAGITAVPGIISVKGQNGCGEGSVSVVTIQVNPLPAQPGSISGPLFVCQGQNPANYNIQPVAGADSYQWITPAGVNILSGQGNVSITASVDSNAVSGVLSVRGHNFQCGDGPTAVINITVNPLPSPAGAITGASPVCETQTGIIFSIQPLQNANSYQWQFPVGFIPQTGTGSPVITLNCSGGAQNGVIKVQGLNAQCGLGRASSKPVTVSPLPGTAGNITGPASVCQGEQHSLYQVTINDPNSLSYSWNLTPSNAGIISGSSGNIEINWSATFTGTAALTVHGVNTCGPGPTSPPVSIQVRPNPNVVFNACNDMKTTKNGRPVFLKGGLPPGGEYSGTGVRQLVTGEWVFDPGQGTVSGAVTGAPYTITYNYLNTYNCSASAVQIIKVYNSNAGQPCPGTFTDIRDGKEYPVFQAGTGINSKCWMASNLDYGTFIPVSQPQMDNCTAEKYCFQDQPAQCSANGALYQWNEVMNYSDLTPVQGLCPPGWHIPDETEWQSLLTFISPGLSPPVDGIAGEILKDTVLTYGFHGLLTGVSYLNSSWKLNDDNLKGTFFWTSSTNTPGTAQVRGINSRNPSVSSYSGSTGNAFHLRCVKD